MTNSIESSPCPECGGTGLKNVGTEQQVPCSACKGTPPVVGASPPEDKPAASNPGLFILIAVVLMGTFLWRAFGVADEIPSPGYRTLTIGLDLLCLGSLIGLRVQASKQASPITLGVNALFWFALLAGLGLFAIRVSSARSWETGHVSYKWDLQNSRSDRVANAVSNDTKTGSTTDPPAAPGSPSAAYKDFFVAYNSKDISAMKSMISKDLLAPIYSQLDRQKADELVDQKLRDVVEHSVLPSNDTRNEKIIGQTATVECINKYGKWYTVDMVKEDGKWKLKTF
jgi:hypothetical protein